MLLCSPHQRKTQPKAPAKTGQGENGHNPTHYTPSALPAPFTPPWPCKNTLRALCPLSGKDTHILNSPHICQRSARKFYSPQNTILRYEAMTRGAQGLKLGFTFLLAFHQKAFHPQHFKLLQIKQQQRCKTGLEST